MPGSCFKRIFLCCKCNTNKSVCSCNLLGHPARATKDAVDNLKDNIRLVFKHMDNSKDGYLQKEEIYGTVNSVFKHHPEKETLVNKLIKAADDNDDGQISLEEFHNLIQKGLQLAEERNSLNMVQNEKQIQENNKIVANEKIKIQGNRRKYVSTESIV